MTLEDFFTLTEMKDGLTAPARVKELITVMQKEKDCIVKNVGDATRQWSTVASTIAATEDKECLNLFVQLDGLGFIAGWLKDAQKFGSDTSESFVEESITALLNALEKLHIDYKKSMSCGIWMIVKDLLGHSSSRVKDRARALFDSWKEDSGGEAVGQDIEKVMASNIDRTEGIAEPPAIKNVESSSKDICFSSESVNEDKHVEPVRDQTVPSKCSDVLQQERIDDIQTQKSGQETTLNDEVNKDELSSNPGKPLSEGTAIIEARASDVLKQDVEGKSDCPKSNEYSGETNQVQNSSLNNISAAMDISSVPKPGEPGSDLGDDAANTEEYATELDLQNNADTKDEASPKALAVDDMMIDVLEPKNGANDAGPPPDCKSSTVFQGKAHNSNTDIPLNPSSEEGELHKGEDLDTSISTEDSMAIDRNKDHSSDESEDLANNPDLLKPSVDAKDPGLVDERKSDMDLDYGMVDALEVARQVAIEVEREVVDRREHSCSSSEKISPSGIRQPDSPDSINGKEIEPVEAESKKVPTGTNLSAEGSPKGGKLLSSVKNLECAETENCAQDLESSQVTEAAQELEVESGKGLSDFDLNQEVCSDDMDRLVSQISTPVSVVSASRAAAARCLPVAPLQFEGDRGWKGSAATSAFRPASPRRIGESNKGSAISGSSKQRRDSLDIDLNVAEAEDDKIEGPLPGKQIPLSSGLPSGESSIEAGPVGSDRLKLDLNRVSDDSDALVEWKTEEQLFQQRNGHHSPSRSSSSSSMQPALRNIDLNDQPAFYNDSPNLVPFLGKSSSQNLNAAGAVKPNGSVISIMGTKVEVNRKDFVPQNTALPNGRNLEPMLDINLGRSGSVLGMASAVPYHPVFGYKGLTMGPTFSSPVYGTPGPIPPYMMDSRGAPVVTPIVGAASASPIAYSQPPMVMGMIGTPSVSNGAGSSRLNFDLNSGLIEGETGNLGV
ncbi:hypothetical protein NMG60_11024460 [Bertholletia excelsa]